MSDGDNDDDKSKTRFIKKYKALSVANESVAIIDSEPCYSSYYWNTSLKTQIYYTQRRRYLPADNVISLCSVFNSTHKVRSRVASLRACVI